MRDMGITILVLKQWMSDDHKVIDTPAISTVAIELPRSQQQKGPILDTDNMEGNCTIINVQGVVH